MPKKNTPQSLPKLPWSHLWSVDSLNREALDISLSPERSLYPDIAQFLDIMALQSLACTLKIQRQSGQHIIHIHGHIRADIEQECIHSLEKIETHIDEEFDSYFADREEAVPFSKAKKELFSKYGMDDTPILEEKEDPEPILNAQIDLGALIVQFLSLAIDPYPCKEEHKENQMEGLSSKKTETQNPFEALKECLDHWKKP